MEYSRSIMKIFAALIPFLTAGCFAPTNSDREADGELRAGNAPAKCITLEESFRMADQVLQLVNLERAEAGLPPVVINSTLERIATEYACRMVEEGFFGHRDPVTGYGPGDRAVAAQYTFDAVGENLAAGPETAAEVMRLWMQSPSHRDNILDPKWRELGVSVRSGGVHSIYWVQEFGAPAEY